MKHPGLLNDRRSLPARSASPRYGREEDRNRGYREAVDEACDIILTYSGDRLSPLWKVGRTTVVSAVLPRSGMGDCGNLAGGGYQERGSKSPGARDRTDQSGQDLSC